MSVPEDVTEHLPTPSRLCALPGEVIARILLVLDFISFARVRMVCRRLKELVENDDTRKERGEYDMAHLVTNSKSFNSLCINLYYNDAWHHFQPTKRPGPPPESTRSHKRIARQSYKVFRGQLWLIGGVDEHHCTGEIAPEYDESLVDDGLSTRLPTERQRNALRTVFRLNMLMATWVPCPDLPYAVCDAYWGCRE